MNTKEYIRLVLRSESPSFDHLNKRLLHGCLGICNEAGELAAAVKRSLFYGRDLDLINVKEELGDTLWFIALCIDELGSSFEEIMELNIAKLKKRYPEQFTHDAATNRDLEAERNALEGE